MRLGCYFAEVDHSLKRLHHLRYFCLSMGLSSVSHLFFVLPHLVWYLLVYIHFYD